jgi:MFS transporter, DHA2 family, multidrug resistance protein
MLMANMFLLPIFMQELLGFDATQSGLAMMPRTLVMMVAVPIVGRLYTRVSPRLLILTGILLVAYGGWDMSHLNLASGTRDVVSALAVQGVGFACLFVPLTTLALAKVPRTRIADATGLNSLIRQIGGAIGLAVFATLLSSDQVVSRASVAAHVSETNPLVQERLAQITQGLAARGMDAASAKQAALGMLNGSVARQGAVLGFDHIFLLCGVLFLAVIPLLFFLKGNPSAEKSDAHVEV